jgi:hypothetical protein
VSLDNKIPQSICPSCLYTMHLAANADGQEGPPVPGDATLCWNCGQLLLFADDLTLRLANAAEIREYMANETAWRTIEKLRREIETRGQLERESRRA